MSFKKTLPIVLLLVAGVLAMAGMQEVLLPETTVVQPIQFDHARHIQEDLKCVQCHAGADNSQYATLPGIKTCLLCHKEAKGDNPEEAKVREYEKSGEAIPWIQVNNVVGHVYFSHGVHIKIGNLDCKECHGDMAAATKSLVKSNVDHLTMDRCIQCHESKNVNQECLTCHK